MIIRIAPLVALLGLAACATGVPVERAVVVSGGSFSAVQGESNLVVRTFLAPEGDERQEVLGATCTVRTSLYSATLVTPSRLVVPNFGPQSPVLGIDCTAGDLAGGVEQRIDTHWRYPPGGPGWGYPGWGYPGWGGPGWGWGGGWGGGGAAYPVFEYPNIAVVLR